MRFYTFKHKNTHENTFKHKNTHENTFKHKNTHKKLKLQKSQIYFN